MSKYLFLMMFPASLWAQTQSITEAYLLKSAQQGSPQLDQIEAAFLSVAVSSGEVQEGFAPELFGQAVYSETNEQALIRFQPVFSPIAQAQLGVRQNLSHGLNTSASIVTDQRSAAPTDFTGRFNDVTTTTLRFTVQMDLWRDLFGRMSKAKLESAEFDKKRAEIEKEIQTKAFNISLRRVYWSLVANQEALKISNELLKTAQQQANETAQRFKNSVAEADEVARYNAQVSARQGSIVYLRYQRESLIKQLKNLLPELSLKDLTFDGYDVPKTIDEVVACTALIASQKQVPYEFTKYDEVVGMLKKVKRNNQVVNSRYSDADVKLFGTAKATGVDSQPSGAGFRGNYGGAFEDIESTNRTGYEVGVQFVLPLGDVKESTQAVKERYDEKRLEALITQNESQVANTHLQLVKSIAFLNDVIRAQKVTSQQLGLRLKGMRKKYEQARVSVNDLVLDQDSLLNTELTTIDTQLQILNTIFDYLVVYTDTPCSFNRM